LGEAERVDEIEIRWPSGKVDALKNVAVDQRLFVHESKGLTRTKAIARGQTRK